MRRLLGPRTQLALGLILGLAGLYLAGRGLNIAQMGRALAAVRLPLVLLAVLVYVVTQCVKAIRWRWLLSARPVGLPLQQLAGVLVIGQAVNLLLPTRLGELARAYLAGQEAHASKAYVLGTIAAEKLLDLIALALLILALVPFMALPAWLAARQGPVILAALFVAAGSAVLLAGRHHWIALVERALRLLPQPAGLRWKGRVLAGLEGLSVLANPAAVLAVWWWTLVAWLLAALTNWLLFLAFSLPLGVIPAVFLLVVLQAGVAVPALPGKIGVIHYLCILALGVFGVPAAQALSYGVVLHLLVVGTSSAWAALALWQRSFSLRQLAALDT